MKKIILIISIMSFYCINTIKAEEKKFTVAVSISPLASITSMLLGDEVNIITIDNSSGCPHEHHLKPSSLNLVKKSDLNIYIDDNFDHFAAKLFQKSKAKTIKISDLKSINFTDYQGNYNWHFWLDLQNIQKLQKYLSSILIKELPELEEKIQTNYKNSVIKISELQKKKDILFSSLGKLVLFTDSMEHFFNKNDKNITKFYTHNNLSLKKFSELEKIIKENNIKCLVVDTEQKVEYLKKFNKKIVNIDSENWSIKHNIGSVPSFYNKYLTIINQLKDCYN